MFILPVEYDGKPIDGLFFVAKSDLYLIILEAGDDGIDPGVDLVLKSEYLDIGVLLHSPLIKLRDTDRDIQTVKVNQVLGGLVALLVAAHELWLVLVLFEDAVVDAVLQIHLAVLQIHLAALQIHLAVLQIHLAVLQIHRSTHVLRQVIVAHVPQHAQTLVYRTNCDKLLLDSEFVLLQGIAFVLNFVGLLLGNHLALIET